MEMPTLTPAHRALDLLGGSWQGPETIHPTPFDPKGGPAIGRVTNRLALDGFAVIQEYEQERGGTVNLRGHGIFRYDGVRNQYGMLWLDSTGQAPGEFWGTLENGTLALTNIGPQGQVRGTWDLRTAGRISYRMEVSGNGINWMLFLTGDYARQP